MLTGDLGTKTYQDVLDFLAQEMPEGRRLDYKQDFPRTLEKTIAAMANAEGGLILVGVAEDAARPRYPVSPPVGVPLDQAVERVIAKAYQAIREPLIPEVQAIVMPDPEKCVVAIRVQPSDAAPHAVENGVRIYLRVDSQSLPVGDLDVDMDVDRMAWLVRRRERNQQFFEAALTRAHMLLDYVAPIPGDKFRFDSFVYPALAHSEPLSLSMLAAQAQGQSRSRYDSFPDNLRSVSGGLVSRNEPREHYLDVQGLTANAGLGDIGPMPNVHPAPERVMYAQWMSSLVLQIHWTAQMAVRAGRGGDLIVRSELRGIRGASLLFGGRGMDAFDADSHRALQDAVSAEVRVPSDEAASAPLSAAVRSLSRIATAFDWDMPADTLSRHFEAAAFAPR
jgi:hypothetical protein